MKKILLTSLLLGASVFADPVPQNIINTGDKLSKELLNKLSSKLKYEMKTNGLLAAASFCNTNAHILTEEVNLHQLEGITVKRISLKERSAANIPLEDETKALQSLQVLLNEKKLPAYVIEESPQSYKYYKPLLIQQEACLKCHGNITETHELSEFLKENYPQDKARGYKMGDLRGAIVVEIKK